MKTTILAAAAVLSLGIGSSYAAAFHLAGYAQNSAATGTSITAATDTNTFGVVRTGPVPNPWDGSESWAQWNHDHPGDAGGGN
jgi:hypothetical protein